MKRYIQLTVLCNGGTQRTGNEIFKTREDCATDIRDFIKGWKQDNPESTDYSESDFDIEGISCNAVYQSEDHLLVALASGDEWQVMIDWDDERYFSQSADDLQGSLINAIRSTCADEGIEYNPELLELA